MTFQSLASALTTGKTAPKFEIIEEQEVKGGTATKLFIVKKARSKKTHHVYQYANGLFSASVCMTGWY